MTEADAKTKKCCGPPSARQLDPQKLCAGSDCMGWVWFTQVRGKVPNGSDYGDCGLKNPIVP